ncbi:MULTISPECIES: hypothetical protein [Methylosinus]|uniref:Uncharacterized protein n=1 Tax=Methylosinus trichosporium (strain ATCC 35070 / NCIMB 11131 / UNIQEM 75 / OB3b) TaxID=595536 RepID=A0A2D2CYR2_METT3|nr:MULTISPECIES: hypothetical protein [Methylosinus]ATQ67872.1 hypothetical protein CQW49_08150 [Methylosinus trichosporium OB3b]OBS50708.1 hypothetical protein A8B73_20135 [Methylosinus sp. 3S-1]
MSAIRTLIIPRRDFLVRALGFTAAGAAVAVPVLALETPEERIESLLGELLKEFYELFPDAELHSSCNGGTAKSVAAVNHACAMVFAAPKRA